MGLSLLTFTLISSQPVAKEIKPEQIADFNKPDIVLVRVKHTVEYEVAKPEIDRDRLSGLAQTVQEKVANGQLTSRSESETFIFSEIIRNPSKYMRPGEKSEALRTFLEPEPDLSSHQERSLLPPMWSPMKDNLLKKELRKQH